MMYLIDVERDTNGTLLATSKVFPEVTTFGDDLEDVRRHAIRALEEAIAARISDGERLPQPASETAIRKHKGVAVKLPLMTVLKVSLHKALLESGATRAELAPGWAGIASKLIGFSSTTPRGWIRSRRLFKLWVETSTCTWRKFLPDRSFSDPEDVVTRHDWAALRRPAKAHKLRRYVHRGSCMHGGDFELAPDSGRRIAEAAGLATCSIFGRLTGLRSGTFPVA